MREPIAVTSEAKNIWQVPLEPLIVYTEPGPRCRFYLDLVRLHKDARNWGISMPRSYT